MFFPLVVLIAVLPGLVALNAWDLTPPGPWWGLRGLAVLEGHVLDQVPAADSISSIQDKAAYRAIAYQPPLYAWLESVGLWLSSERAPLAGVLPSYIAGGIVVVLVYLHGRLWRGGGVGLAAAVLVGFNQELLLRLQVASPSTLALAGALAALLCYGWHERTVTESAGPWPWAGPTFWSVAGGLALGFSLLAMAWVGLLVIPVVVLHQFYLRGGLPRGGGGQNPPTAAPATRWAWVRPVWRERRSFLRAAIAFGVAAVVVLPWHMMMFQLHGWESFNALLSASAEARMGDRPDAGLITRLIDLAPASVPLAIFGAARSIRLALIDENNSDEAVGGALWVIWLSVAALASSFWPGAPKTTLDLFLLVPLSLLAAQSVADLINRKLPVRSLTILAPATAVAVAWWLSLSLREALDDLLHARASASTALGLHLAVDLVIVLVYLTRKLNLWGRRRDDRQRLILAAFLLAILAITVTSGMQEIRFRNVETLDLLNLRTAILRRNRERPFGLVAVVGPEWMRGASRNDAAQPETDPARGPRDAGGAFLLPGGRLRFILKSALPNLNQLDLASVDDLLSLHDDDVPGSRLVIVTGTDHPLSSPVRSSLGLEKIHPGRTDVLDAYATPTDRTPKH